MKAFDANYEKVFAESVSRSKRDFKSPEPKKNRLGSNFFLKCSPTNDHYSIDVSVPEMALTREDWEMVALVNRELEHYITLLEDAREREAISAVFNISRLGNQLMQHNTPWKLVKV